MKHANRSPTFRALTRRFKFGSGCQSYLGDTLLECRASCHAVTPLEPRLGLSVARCPLPVAGGRGGSRKAHIERWKPCEYDYVSPRGFKTQNADPHLQTLDGTDGNG